MSPLRFDPEALRRARASRGLSQRSLGTLARLGHPRVWWYETGRKQPTLSSVSRMADALGVELSDLLTRDAHAPRKAVSA